MTVSILVPFGSADDPHRVAARAAVLDRLDRLHPTWEVVTEHGPWPGEWNKGEAVERLARSASGDVLVIHDADSYVEPDNLAEAVDLVTSGRCPWYVPHGTVYRLNQRETDRVLAGNIARRGHTIRTPYPAVPGGGITVVPRAAYDLVGGIDPRFLGWGGEDIAFGYALDTLVGPHGTGSSPLIHLWHPHPAPDLRGPPDSEALVAEYRAARGLRRRMADLCARRPVAAPTTLEQPVTFRIPRGAARTTVRIAGTTAIVFPDGTYTAYDPDIVDALRAHPLPIEVTR